MQPLLPGSPREGGRGDPASAQCEQGQQLIPAWPTALGSPWSPAGPEHPRAGLAGAGPSTIPSALPGNATTTPLCAQNMKLNSIIYTVFADDSDTGNASKVSYSIEEVSAGLSPNTPGIALDGGSVCWGVGGRENTGGPRTSAASALCQREDAVA